MRKFLVLLLFLVTTVGSNDSQIKSALNILNLRSSKVLTNFQGKMLNFDIVQSYQISREFNIHQISKTAFIILDSPIKWESPE